ncbi:MAG: peptide deformylase [Simkaniaceae bacterium]|nr:peptide deformylase [Simkaniaceae bacterium]
MILDLVFYDDPRLRVKCKRVEEINDEIKKLVSDMIETMVHDNRSIGLAAPQVGADVRIFVATLGEFDSEGKVHYDPPQAYINPVLSEPSQELVEYEEFCMSIPDVGVDVVRPNAITLEWMDLEGKMHKERYEGFKARMVMHENDHLNGVLTIDRAPRRKRMALKPQLRKVIKKYPQS